MADPVDHIACRQVVELVTDYLEGALPDVDVSLFEEHLNLCDGCVSYVEQMRMTIDAVGRIGVEHLPPEIRDDLVEAFRDFKRRR
jgi:predicted anti-sigma-YlaC factor YlaD